MLIRRVLRPAGLLLCLLLIAASTAHAERGPDIPDSPAEEVAPGVYFLYGDLGYPSPQNDGFMSNASFIVTDDGVIVVDTGSSVQIGEMILRQIRKVTDKPLLAVLNTHVHGDHWLGNQAMLAEAPDVPIYAHPNMHRLVAEGAGERWLETMMQATDGAVAGTEPMGPTHTLDDGEILIVGGLTIKAHHYPKVHSTSDLMFEIPERGVLFLADNANNRRIVRMDDGSFRGSLDALDDIRERVDATVLIPGHGRPGGWEIVEAYRGYLDGLYTGVADLYDEGMSDFEMKPRLIEQLKRYQDWSGFEDELGKHISLVYLEVEAEAF